MSEKVILGTTPTIKYHINSEVNLLAVKEASIVIKQKLKHEVRVKEFLRSKWRVIVKPKEKIIYATLTQEETLAFNSGLVDIQLRILFNNGLAVATRISTVKTGDLLKGGVIK